MKSKGLKEWITWVTNWINKPWLHSTDTTTDTFYRVTRDDTNTSVSFGVGSSGINHGIWSGKQGRWLVCGDTKAVIVGNHIFLGDYTNRAKQINSALTTSSSINDWLLAVTKAICQDYPNLSHCIFHGEFSPNSLGYFELEIYDTSILSNGVPQYSFGTWRQYINTIGIFGTQNYTFTYTTK